MQRSDNFAVCAIVERLCIGDNGKLFVYTGFPVKSAIVTPIRVPDGAEIMVDTTFEEENGFYVLYSNMPEASAIVKFSYQAA